MKWARWGESPEHYHAKQELAALLNRYGIEASCEYRLALSGGGFTMVDVAAPSLRLAFEIDRSPVGSARDSYRRVRLAPIGWQVVSLPIRNEGYFQFDIATQGYAEWPAPETITQENGQEAEV